MTKRKQIFTLFAYPSGSRNYCSAPEFPTVANPTRHRLAKRKLHRAFVRIAELHMTRQKFASKGSLQMDFYGERREDYGRWAPARRALGEPSRQRRLGLRL
jgi:hypothetical protein